MTNTEKIPALSTTVPSDVPAGHPSSEDVFLAAYDPSIYDRPSLTVDTALFTLRDGQLSILLVQRADHPYKGAWALPGGFLDLDRDADLDDAAYRELAEETGVTLDVASGWYLEQLYTYGRMDRDPRTRVVTTAYYALAPKLADPTAGSDAVAARWWPVADLADLELAFDHSKIITDALERVRSKLEYTSLATRLIAEPFTLSELRRVYEAVWGTTLSKPSFDKRMGRADLVLPVEDASPAPTGGRPAQLYRRGTTELLPPPFPRPSR